MPDATSTNLPVETTEFGVQPLAGSLALVLLLAVVCFVLVGVAYARHPASWRHRALLVLLRAGLVVLLAILLANPQIYTTRTVPVRRQVAVLLDKSQSMGMTDAAPSEAKSAAMQNEASAGPVATDGDQPRLQRVKNWLGNGQNGFLRKLGDRWDVRCYDFADACSYEGMLSAEEQPSGKAARDDWAQQLNPAGDGTALGDSLEYVARETRDHPLAAVVLVTDGRTCKGRDPLKAAQTLADRQVPVYAVGLGRLTVKDVEVRALTGPEVAFQDDQLTLAATLAQTGFTDGRATVRLLRDGQPVDRPSATVTAELTQEPVTVQLADVLTKSGTFQYEVRIDVLDGETDATNNQRSKTVRCVDDALRTLYVEDRPRWEWRFLRDALVRDKRIRHGFETVLFSADDRAATTEREYRRAYPATVGELERYDLIIFGDVDPKRFTPEQLRVTAEFVGEHAGGFLMIAGRKNAPHSFKGTAIEKLLPLRLSEQEPPPSRRDPFRAVLTAAGREENALRLAADREANDALWRRLPDLVWCYPLGDPQPLAATLLVNNSLRTAAGEAVPVLAAAPYGNGTAAVLGTDNTWRWRSVDNAKYYDLFWGQMIQWLGLPRLRARKQMPDFRVSQDRVWAGDSVTLTAQLPLQGKAEKSLPVNCQRDREAVQRWTLEAVAARPGTYSAAFPVRAAGEYRAWLTEPKSGESLSVRFQARPAPAELTDPTMNRSLLAALCRQTGGELHSLATADRILEQIPTGTINYTRTGQRPLWGTPLLLFSILAVVAGEWFYRKRMNLR